MKKAQTTIFVIIGLLLIMGVIFVFTMKESVRREQDGYEFSTDSFENVVDECLYTIVIDTIQTKGICDGNDFDTAITEVLPGCINTSLYSYEFITMDSKVESKTNITEEQIQI